MGWSSATEIFDAMLEVLFDDLYIEDSLTFEQIDDILVKVIRPYLSNDYDTYNESHYFNRLVKYPRVRELLNIEIEDLLESLTQEIENYRSYNKRLADELNKANEVIEKLKNNIFDEKFKNLKR